jgi:hypothetical protein
MKTTVPSDSHYHHHHPADGSAGVGPGRPAGTRWRPRALFAPRSSHGALLTTYLVDRLPGAGSFRQPPNSPSSSSRSWPLPASAASPALPRLRRPKLCSPGPYVHTETHMAVEKAQRLARLCLHVRHGSACRRRSYARHQASSSPFQTARAGKRPGSAPPGVERRRPASQLQWRCMQVAGRRPTFLVLLADRAEPRRARRHRSERRPAGDPIEWHGATGAARRSPPAGRSGPFPGAREWARAAPGVNGQASARVLPACVALQCSYALGGGVSRGWRRICDVGSSRGGSTA